MSRFKLVQQVQQTECGLCCVLMILRYYKSNETLEDLRECLEAGRDGLNIIQLRDLLDAKKFDTRMIKCNINKTEDIRCLSEVEAPFIAFWNKQHFVIVSKVKNNYIEILDPASGKRKLKYSEFMESFSGYILEAVPTSEFVPKKEKPKRWSYILTQLLKEKKIIVLVSILSVLSYCLSILFPKITQWFVDNYLTQLMPETSDFEMVLVGIFISIILTIIIYFLRFFTVVIMKINTEKVLLKKVFSHLINLPYSFFETRTYGDLITRLGSVNYVKDFILDNVISSVFDFGIGIILIVYIGTISYKILLAALLLIIINSLTLIVTRKPIEFSNKEEIIDASQVNSIQVETIYSIFTTKILRLEDIVLKNWSRAFKAYLQKRKEREYYQVFITAMQSILNTIAPLVMVLAGYFAYKNRMVSLGDIIISQSFILNLLSISSKVINTFNIYLIASNYLDRVIDITNKDVEKTTGEILEDIDKIEFKNVDFSYNKDGQKVLKNISLNISKGQKVAFVGSTGSGKSTLAKLLMGLYEPVKGQVLINGKDMVNLDKDNLLKLATIVPQDIYIYAKNIEENIKLERQNVTIDDVQEAAKVSCIHEDIMQFPLKYNTMLSDMGMNLSGGQRQRIVIARALISKPQMIVFDEGTSFLDNVTEKKIMKNLKQKEATIVMIAHRLDTIIDSDKIYFLKNGEIIESGTHEELMSKRGEYYKLYTARGENVVSVEK